LSVNLRVHMYVLDETWTNMDQQPNNLQHFEIKSKLYYHKNEVFVFEKAVRKKTHILQLRKCTLAEKDAHIVSFKHHKAKLSILNAVQIQ
jgi:hypothetical protein